MFCNICFEEKKTLKIGSKCQHSFCPECINKWVSINNSCPCCRKIFCRYYSIIIILKRIIHSLKYDFHEHWEQFSDFMLDNEIKLL